MFRYQDNKKVSGSGESQRRVVTKVREVEYLNWHPNPKVQEPIVSKGMEVVEEMVVSSDWQGVPMVVGKKTIDARNESQRRTNYRPKKTMNPDKQEQE